ncbi:hypothetical protein FHW92_002101 [Novosphingobium sp. SG707]|nr:hypothetical protein [Novosphingobium sp. SG707]
MQLLWFSPLPPAKTDVANFTHRLAPHLHSMADVTFVHPGKSAKDISDFGADFATCTISSLSTQMMNQADLCIYQIGNNAAFHSEIFALAQRHPGLVVLHDRAMQDFVFNHQPSGLMGGGFAADTYRQAMGQWYGQSGLDAADMVMRRKIFPADIASLFPLFEAVLDKALGVICHNREVTEEIYRRFPKLLALTLPLPFAAPAERPARPPITDDTPIRIVMFGFMGGNRRATEFLDAWALSEYRDRFHLHLSGQMSDRARFDARAAELHLSGQITYHGFLSEAALNELIRSAHMALNLRYPTMGEASGSQLRIWANGCPSAVSASGWYAGLPDRCLRKIHIQTEHDDLLLLLRDLATHRINGDEMARYGFAQMSEHDPLRYTRNLLAWIARKGSEMTAQWTDCALMESVARSYAGALPIDFDVAIPPHLLRS